MADWGIASKHSIQTGAGVIDADYRGPVMVLLFNHSDTDFEGTPFFTTHERIVVKSVLIYDSQP